MFFLPIFAAISASFGWALGIVLAQGPALKLGSFEFTRVQLIACATIMSIICTAMGHWSSVDWFFWPAYLTSICIGIILGNLAMIECLRRGGPRRTELLLSMKAPLVGVMAYFWLGEVPTAMDALGASVVLAGVFLAIFFTTPSALNNDEVHGSVGLVVLFGLIAATFQGFGFLIMKPALLEGLSPMAATAVRLLGAAAIISVISLWPAQSFKAKEQMTPMLLFHTILPGFIGYAVSSTLLLYAFANFDAGIATVLGSLSPVLVLPIIWLKDRQAPSPRAIVGALMSVFGTAIIIGY